MTDNLATAPPQQGLGLTLRPLAASYLVTYAGDGIFYVCAALYFTRIVGLSPIVYGAVLTGSWLLAMPLGVPVGHLADRFDSRTVSMVMVVLSGVSVAVYVVVSNVAVFAVAACVLAICTQGTYAARSALVGRTFAIDKLTKARAALVAVSNAGLAIGAGIGALVIADDTPTGYRLAFAGDAASFLIAALLLLAVPRTIAPRATATEETEQPAASPLGVFRDRGYALVSTLNAVLTLHVPLIDVALPLWIVGHTSAPDWSVAAVFVVNTALVVLLQYRTAKRIDGIDVAVRSLRIAGLLLFTGMALYALSGTPRSPSLACVVLLAAVAVLTFGEMRQTTSMTEISFRLVPGARYGQYQGFFGMGSTLSEAVGPLLLTWLVLSNGVWGWLALGALLLLASVGMRFAVDLARRAPMVRENVA